MKTDLQKPRRVLAIDAMNLLSRAYFGIPLSFDREKRPNNALRGWFNTWFLLQEQLKPDQIIAVFDGGRDQTRLQALPEYKANRATKPAEYTTQVEDAYTLCGSMGILNYRKSGIEADDILFTLSRNIPEDHEMLVFSNDKDLTQCINPRCKLAKPTQKDRQNSIELWDEDRVATEFGVKPEQMALFLAMVGDASDNIPGVQNIGPKKAAKLIAQHRDQETLVHAPEMSGEGQWQALAAALEVTQAKIIPGIAWPPIAGDEDIDCEFLETICRKRALFRVADRFLARLDSESKGRKLPAAMTETVTTLSPSGPGQISLL
jgi:DNA polymerase-1